MPTNLRRHGGGMPQTAREHARARRRDALRGAWPHAAAHEGLQRALRAHGQVQRRDGIQHGSQQ